VDRVQPLPAVVGLDEDVRPAAARPAPVGSAAAPVALAQAEQVGLAAAAQAGEPFQSLVRAVEREVQPPAGLPSECLVELVHLGQVAARMAFHRLDEGEVPLTGRVVGDVLVPDRTRRLEQQGVAVAPRHQLRVEPRNVPHVVEHDPQPAPGGEDAAGLEPVLAARHADEQVANLRLPEQPQHRRPAGSPDRLHAPDRLGSRAGSGSAGTGKFAPLAPRGSVRRNCRSCARALSCRMRT
jgi:hypothetical protein